WSSPRVANVKDSSQPSTQHQQIEPKEPIMTLDPLEPTVTASIAEDGTLTTEVDYKTLYESTRGELERTQVLVAAQKTHGASPASTSRAGLTAAQVRSQVGELPFLNMGRVERLMAVGADPSVSDEFLKKLFGRGSDANFARDLNRTDPQRYRTLREAALVTGAYAA
ncbi:MAG: hypothetical protein ACRD3K_14755, partial [Edaphobacter sp.]